MDRLPQLAHSNLLTLVTNDVPEPSKSTSEGNPLKKTHKKIIKLYKVSKNLRSFHLRGE